VVDVTDPKNAELVDGFQKFFREYYHEEIGELATRYPREQRSLEIDYMDLYRFDPDLATDWVDKPDKMGEYAEEALRLYDLPVDVNLGGASVRVTNLNDPLNIGEYDPAYDENRLLPIRGQVTKRGEKKLKITEAAFECQRCGTLTHVPQNPGGDFQEPHECEGCERQGPFRINDNQSEKENFQKIRIQTPPDHSQGEGNEELDVNLGPDLVNSVTPGDRVVVNATLRSQQETQNNSKMPLAELYAEAESIEKQESDFGDIEVEPHLDRIQEIANSPETFELLVDSFCATHKGDREVKLGIILQLAGGVRKISGDGSVTRGDPHMLLIGDPGTGKSTLLKYASNIAPRSVWTTGDQSTKAGLTCAAVKDDFSGGWTLEGGAMVQANKGIACVDEFNNMSDEDQKGMKEALAQQTVSPSKAGLKNVQLPAQTTLLGAANPIYGRFDRYEGASDQLGLDPAVFSRFDLIFIITDKPDEETDRDIASHRTSTAQSDQMRARGADPESDAADPPISEEVFRAYIAYVREVANQDDSSKDNGINPVLTTDAKEMIEDAYVDIRMSNDDVDSAVPTTARTIDGMIRLAEASAKLRLSGAIEEEDAERAISLVRKCLKDVGVDPESGEFDADLIETGMSKSQNDRMRTVKTEIADLENEYKRGAPVDVVVENCVEVGFSQSKVESALDKLKDKGKIYEASSDHLRTT